MLRAFALRALGPSSQAVTCAPRYLYWAFVSTELIELIESSLSSRYADRFVTGNPDPQRGFCLPFVSHVAASKPAPFKTKL
jgi:hypothetical protein